MLYVIGLSLCGFAGHLIARAFMSGSVLIGFIGVFVFACGLLVTTNTAYRAGRKRRELDMRSSMP